MKKVIEAGMFKYLSTVEWETVRITGDSINIGSLECIIAKSPQARKVWCVYECSTGLLVASSTSDSRKNTSKFLKDEAIELANKIVGRYSKSEIATIVNEGHERVEKYKASTANSIT